MSAGASPSRRPPPAAADGHGASGHGRRSELLDELIEVVSRDGIGDRSLRDLAAAVGTSHRMLIHHFGSADAVRLAVVREVEARQTRLALDTPDDPLEATWAMWQHLARPELRPFERLFFECYARGAQGEEPYAALVPAAVHDWLDAVGEHPGAGDPAVLRLGLAVMRGLLLDLVATGDRAELDAAMTAWIDLLRLSVAGAGSDAES